MAGKGRIWRTTERGILLNDARRELIQPQFSALLADAIATCVNHSEADLHSLYITGSIPRGLAVPGESDFNLIGVLEYSVDPELVMQDWIPLAEANLLKDHHHVSDVQIELWPQGYIFRDPDEFSIGAFIIVTNSVCVWGSDLTPELPEYNLNDRNTRLGIANDDIFHLMPDIDDAWASVEADSTAENVRSWCRHVCKGIVLTGFSLCMDEAGLHTRDTDVALETFSHYYPEQAADMAKTAEFAHRPTSEAAVLLELLSGHGEWLIDRCEDWLDTHNPERHEFFFTGEDDHDTE